LGFDLFKELSVLVFWQTWNDNVIWLQMLLVNDILSQQESVWLINEILIANNYKCCLTFPQVYFIIMFICNYVQKCSSYILFNWTTNKVINMFWNVLIYVILMKHIEMKYVHQISHNFKNGRTYILELFWLSVLDLFNNHNVYIVNRLTLILLFKVAQWLCYCLFHISFKCFKFFIFVFVHKQITKSYGSCWNVKMKITLIF